MRRSRIKGKISRNEPALCVQLHITDGSIFELTSLLGFDGIWMDLEHHGYGVETAGRLMQAARVGSSDIVARPGKGEFMRMGRLLELGAQAIMYPRCDSPAEAAEVVRWSKFPPLGTRGFDGSGADSVFTSVPEKETAKAIQKNIEKFESQCRKNDMEYRVHKDSLDFAMPALRKETRFADLLIIGSESFYENFEIDEPSESLKDALHHSECPIVVVPEKFEFPETNILTYDGSTDSVYAIRQFVYLFPELCRNETLLVYASKEDNQEFPDESYIEELTARHYPNLTLMKLQLNPRKYFNSWIEDHRSAIVISGSFSRSGFSQIFKKSFITKVIRDHKIPVFIAHL
jgi:hypothetical protein